MFVRQAAHAPDFNDYLHNWHRQRWWKGLLARFIRRVWRHDGRCMHKPGVHWCRARDTEMRVPPLGPLEPGETVAVFPPLPPPPPQVTATGSLDSKP